MRAGAKHPLRLAGAQLSSRQLDGLRRQLATYLGPLEVERLLEAVQHWFAFPPWDVGPLIESVKWSDDQARRRARLIGKLARVLHRELSRDPPFVGRFGVVLSSTHHLELLIEDADAAAAEPKRSPGQPRREWRDDLVALLHAHHPPTKRAITEDGPFERTVEMVLGFLGVNQLADLHREIRRILARSPSAPFVIHPE